MAGTADVGLPHAGTGRAARTRTGAPEAGVAYRQTADNLPTNEAEHIERVHGRHELVLSGLDKLDEPPSLIGLKTLVAQRLPRVELPELLLEVQAWTASPRTLRM